MSNLSAGMPSAVDGLIYSKDQRLNAGISSPDYVDTYNSAMLQDYGARLAAWFYENYQSPSAMAKQYEEAGLNRNFASTNTSSPSVPGVSARSNIAQSRSQRINSTLSAINTTLQLINTGVDVVSSLTNLPKDLAIKEYQKTISKHQSFISGEQAEEGQWKAFSAMLRGMYDAQYYGGASIDWQNVFAGSSKEGYQSLYSAPVPDDHGIYQVTPAMQQAFSRNALMDLKVKLANYDLNNLKPEQVRQIQENIDKLAVQSDYLGIQKDMYSTLKASGLLVPIIVSLLKFL